MLSKNLAGSLHKEKRDILIMSYLSSLEFECLLFEVTSYWLPWCKFSGLLPEQKKVRKGGGKAQQSQMAMDLTERRYCAYNAVSLKFWTRRSKNKWMASGENGNIWETRENVLKSKLLSTSPIAIIRQTHSILQSIAFQVHICIIGKNTQGPKTKFCLKHRHQRV